MESFDASKSEGSSEEWLDLSKSNYANVIFSNLDWNSTTGDVGCYFTLTETVNKNPSDYIGIYKVGYDCLSQCLAMKKLNEFDDEDDSKPIHCLFKAEEMPELDGFYHFLYVNHENEVCGASLPFEARFLQASSSSGDEAVATENIENDYLLVRYGLEQKNYKLETRLKELEEENDTLITEIKELREKNTDLSKQMLTTVEGLENKVNEINLLKEDHLLVTTQLKSEIEKRVKAEVALETSKDSNESLLHKYNEKLKENEECGRSVSGLRCAIRELMEETGRREKEIISRYDRMAVERIQELKCKETEMEKIKNDFCALDKEKDSLINKLEENLTQSNVRAEQLEKKIKEMIQEKENEKERYHQLEVELRDSRSECYALERDVTHLKLYLQNSEQHGSPKTSVSKSQESSSGERLLAEELEDGKCMIKALEDSKQLAMQEMHDLSHKLKMLEGDLARIKCENMALKSLIADKNNSDPKEEVSRRNCEKINFLTLADKNNSVPSEKKENVSVSKNSDEPVTKLLSNVDKIYISSDISIFNKMVKEKIVEIIQIKDEEIKARAKWCESKCENMALKLVVEEKKSHDNRTKLEVGEEKIKKLVDIVNSQKEEIKKNLTKLEEGEEKTKMLVDTVNSQKEEIKKMKEECKKRDFALLFMRKVLNLLSKENEDSIPLEELEDRVKGVVDTLKSQAIKIEKMEKRLKPQVDVLKCILNLINLFQVRSGDFVRLQLTERRVRDAVTNLRSQAKEIKSLEEDLKKKNEAIEHYEYLHSCEIINIPVVCDRDNKETVEDKLNEALVTINSKCEEVKKLKEELEEKYRTLQRFINYIGAFSMEKQDPINLENLKERTKKEILARKSEKEAFLKLKDGGKKQDDIIQQILAILWVFREEGEDFIPVDLLEKRIKDTFDTLMSQLKQIESLKEDIQKKNDAIEHYKHLHLCKINKPVVSDEDGDIYKEATTEEKLKEAFFLISSKDKEIEKLKKECKQEDDTIEKVLEVLNLFLKYKNKDPINLSNGEERIKEVIVTMTREEEAFAKLKEGSKKKDEKIQDLLKLLYMLKTSCDMRDVSLKDKTARIVEGAELYKELYKEKEKLAKKVKKLSQQKTGSKKTAVSNKEQEDSNQSSLELTGVECSASCETKPNNSDSDTGERVQAGASSLNLVEGEGLPEAPLKAESNLSQTLQDCQIRGLPSDLVQEIDQALLEIDSSQLSCTICGEQFPETPNSILAHVDHVMKIHHMKSVQSVVKYLKNVSLSSISSFI